MTAAGRAVAEKSGEGDLGTLGARGGIRQPAGTEKCLDD